MARLVATTAVAAALLSPASAFAGVLFAPAQTYDVGTKPVQVVAADLNADGLTDLATVNDNAVAGSQVSLLLANSNGGFTVSGIANTDNARSIAAGDINGDGAPDLAVANHGSADGSDGLSVFINNGHGAFSGPDFHDITDGDNPWGVAIADTRGLGSRNGIGIDVVVTGDHHGGSGSRTTVFLNNGRGLLTELPAVPSFANARGVTAADLNGDLLPDLVEANGGPGGGAHDLLNLSGVFNALSSVTLPGVQDAQWIAAGDLTGDGAPDMAIPSVAEDSVYVAAGNGLGAFPSVPVAHSVGDAPVGVTIADLDRDGHPDLAAANSGATNDVSLLLGTGGTELSAVPTLQLPAAAGAQSVVATDMNADGYPDIAVADTAASKVSVFHAIPPAVDVSPSALAFADVRIGTTAVQPITITNLGPQTLFLPLQPQVTGRDGFDYAVANSTCSTPVAPAQSCHFDVAFTPSDRGVRLGFVSLTTSGRGAPPTLSLSGVGVVAPPVLTQPSPAQSVLGSRVAATTRCVVPKLKGKTLKKAKQLLKKAHCKLGKVKRTRLTKQARAKLETRRYRATTVISKQSPKAKKRLKKNAKVAVTVHTQLKRVKKSVRKR